MNSAGDRTIPWAALGVPGPAFSAVVRATTLGQGPLQGNPRLPGPSPSPSTPTQRRHKTQNTPPASNPVAVRHSQAAHCHRPTTPSLPHDSNIQTYLYLPDAATPGTRHFISCPNPYTGPRAPIGQKAPGSQRVLCATWPAATNQGEVDHRSTGRIDGHLLACTLIDSQPLRRRFRREDEHGGQSQRFDTNQAGLEIPFAGPDALEFQQWRSHDQFWTGRHTERRQFKHAHVRQRSTADGC